MKTPLTFVASLRDLKILPRRLRKLCSDHFPTLFDRISCCREAPLRLSGLAVFHPTLQTLALLVSGVSLILSSRMLPKKKNTGLENSQFHNANTCLQLNVLAKENASQSKSEIMALTSLQLYFSKMILGKWTSMYFTIARLD